MDFSNGTFVQDANDANKGYFASGAWSFTVTKNTNNPDCVTLSWSGGSEPLCKAKN